MSDNGYHKRNPIKRHGQNPTEHFTMVPNEMFREGALTAYAVHLALYIRSHADGFEISQRSLANNLKIRHETVRKYLRELTASGWLAISEYKTANGKRAYEEYHVHAARRFTDDEMTRYNRTVILPPVAEVCDDTAHPCATTPHTPVRSDRTPLCDYTAHKEDHLEHQVEEQKEHQAPATDVGQDDPYCQECEDAECNVCMLHFHEREYRYREPGLSNDTSPCNPASVPDTVEINETCAHHGCNQPPLSTGYCVQHYASRPSMADATV